MKIFNRSEEMMSYVENYYKESRLYTAQNDAKGKEFDIIQNIIDDFPYQMNPQTATWGLFLWEELCGLPTNTKEEIETRRFRVLLLLGMASPMTPKVMEKLIFQAIKYPVKIQNSKIPYTFHLLFEDLGLNDIINMELLRETVETLKPAHLTYYMMFYFYWYIYECILADLSVTFISEFYPRHNVPELFNNGYAIMDGTYYMNGLQSGKFIDFYPVELTVQSGVQSQHEIVSGIVLPTDVIHGKTLYNTAVNLSSYWITKSKYEDALMLSSQVEQKVFTDINQGLSVFAKQDTKFDSHLLLYDAVESYSAQQSQISVQSSAIANKPSYVSHLTVEKALGYNDGVYLMDGSRFMDAEIFEYEL